jgi:hypothetical protein
MSVHGREEGLWRAADYEISRRGVGLPVNPDVIRRIIDGDMAHLVLTVLDNGLRHVTIHTEDGAQIHNEREYAGAEDIRTRGPSATALMAKIIEGADLGDGFRLLGVCCDREYVPDVFKAGDPFTTSKVGKTFDINGNTFEVTYVIKEKSGKLELENFRIERRTFRQFRYAERSWRNVGSGGYLTKFWLTGNVVAESEMVEMYGDGRSLMRVSQQLSNRPSSFGLEWNTAEFGFDKQGKPAEVDVSIADVLGNVEPLPEWRAALAAIRERQEREGRTLRFSPEDPEAKAVSVALLARNITELAHQAAETLAVLVNVAVSGADVVLRNVMKFE